MRRRKINRKRELRRVRGQCGKRRYQDVEEATRRAAGVLVRPGNRVTKVAIYLCHLCGKYHYSRQTEGTGIVRILEVERG